ncbi:PEP-utilizing enzyme [Actinoplanes couchii]|uniref:PEP-utilising enzyme mobile domain-containing protein n=1 Tax=Actinoplanes couchii TaxID=403638 RepID=A0ABQ3XSN9_9ACTN|nr:PEP-utilizing enzyme [Actinoplanes couchii]MDR6315925.1 phosphoenolpyruvate synthase/pyruvate phosphate dikinase [Actinoplanes couchii]GID61425.1 hypothetical protein Aco03nite_098290 [Actinoplanes couchii]
MTTVIGTAASPGVAEGPARVVHTAADIAEVRPGEVLVAPMTSPEWLAVFNRVIAVVTDSGGVTCHAAIVSREYGIPAVTGTSMATTAIVTGARIRVDGDQGEITVLR